MSSASKEVSVFKRTPYLRLAALIAFGVGLFALLVLLGSSLNPVSVVKASCPGGQEQCRLIGSRIVCICKGSGSGGPTPGSGTPGSGGGGGGKGGKKSSLIGSASCVNLGDTYPTGVYILGTAVGPTCGNGYYNIDVLVFGVCEWTESGGMSCSNAYGAIPVMILSCAGDCKTPVPPKVIPPTACTSFQFTGAGLTCNLNWMAAAKTEIPPVPVSYTPYPRGLNDDQMTFFAAGLITQGWQCSQPPIDGWDPQTWSPNSNMRQFQFCLRWKQVANPGPDESRKSPYGSYDPAPAWAAWNWDERPWGNPKGELAKIPLTSHTYVTSSADDTNGNGYQHKPHNGPGNLPSYQVRVTTYWMVQYMMQWQYKTCVKSPNPSDSCNGVSGKVEAWLNASQGPFGLDLRMPGINNAHYWTTSGSLIVPDGRKMNVLPVPVIEVQGVQPTK
jgi:hypothetical protein